MFRQPDDTILTLRSVVLLIRPVDLHSLVAVLRTVLDNGLSNGPPSTRDSDLHSGLLWSLCCGGLIDG